VVVVKHDMHYAVFRIELKVVQGENMSDSV
jgi:hypothetical protein